MGFSREVFEHPAFDFRDACRPVMSWDKLVALPKGIYRIRSHIVIKIL